MIDYTSASCIAFRYEPGEGEPMRICAPCRSMLPVSVFVGDMCADCNTAERARLEAGRRDRLRQYWRDKYEKRKLNRNKI